MRPSTILILCVVLVIVVVIPDVIFELLHGLFELVLQLLHTLFDILEVILDNLVEHLFDTNLHDTQIIVFYILMALGAYGAYLAWRLSLKVCRRCMERWTHAQTAYKTQVSDYWQHLGSLKKFQVVLLGTTSISIIFFFLFM